MVTSNGLENKLNCTQRTYLKALAIIYYNFYARWRTTVGSFILFYQMRYILFYLQGETLPVTGKDDRTIAEINTVNRGNFARQETGLEKIWQAILT